MKKLSSSSKSGSALLLTLLVVTLLLVMVLSLTVYVRLELRSVQNRIDLVQARQNAKLGMHLALNKLQVAAGSDQRVTARADILGATVSGANGFWTGVWENNLLGGVEPNPVWLVSGISPDPVNGAGANSFEIFPSVNTIPAIRVPLEDINDESGAKIGEVAYWVADEGVKASVGARRQAIDIYNGPNLADEEQRRFAEYQIDFGINLEPFFTSPTIDLEDANLPKSIGRARSITDYLIAKDDSNALIFQPINTDLPFHDITTIAYGVLENSVDGGLKVNLSDLAPSDTATDVYSATESYDDSFLHTDETRKFLDPDKADTLQIEYGDPADLGILEGDPYFSPRPILTEAVLYVGLFFNPGDREVKTRYHIGAEFLNPYSLPLFLDSGTFGEVTLLFEGLPTLTVTDGSGTKPTLVKSMDDAANRNSSTSVGYYTSVEISPISPGDPSVLLPGEVYKSLAPSQSQGLSRTIGTGWVNPLPPDDTIITVESTHANVPLVIKVIEPNYNALLTDVDVIQEITIEREDVAFTNMDYQESFSDFNIGKSSGLYTLDEDYTFAYHFRLWSDEADKGSMKELMKNIPILDPFLESSFEFTDSSGVTKRIGDYIIPADLDPRLIFQNGPELFSQLDFFRDELEATEGHNGSNQFVYIVDVPTENVLSVGQLTSLPLYRKPPHFIGSPGAADFNEAFDKYYFSPKEFNVEFSQNILLSPSLLHVGSLVNSVNTISDIADINDAENELIIGQFNINSTSETAWEAVLSAPILTAKALDEPAGNAIPRTGVFARLPQLQANLEDYFVSNAEIEKPENAFAQGVRVLGGTSGQEQIQEVATYIVEQLKQKTEPFPDLKSFVNSGIIQDAIDDATDSSGVGVNDDLFEYSNVYLRQNDVFTKIAPYASTRSDTFKIRAHGKHMNPSTGNVLSSATCEVVVQRIPQKIDGTNPMLVAANFLNMRKFQIMSFRWLTDEDL